MRTTTIGTLACVCIFSLACASSSGGEAEGGGAGGMGGSGAGGSGGSGGGTGGSGGGGTGGATSPDPLPSDGCAADFAASGYARGATTAGTLDHDGLTRSFRVHVPPSYDHARPAPLLVMLHGGGGSGRQLEEASARMNPIADREGFVVVYPDGTGAIRTWNGGGCCGSAVTNGVDDVGFVAALLDDLEGKLCVERRRVHAAGMSNGAILAHRLGCELSERFAAIAPVAGTDMTASCAPARPVAVLQLHGTADGHVPFDGGEGCGPARVAFTSVPATVEAWRQRDGCAATTRVTREQGDLRCESHDGCAAGADVTLCRVEGAGHSWPGGVPHDERIECPANGPQSDSFSASELIWAFLRDHPRREP